MQLSEPALLPGHDDRKVRVAVVCYDPIELETLIAALDVTGETPLEGSRFPVVHGRLDGAAISVMRIPFGDRPDLLRSIVTRMARAVRPAHVVSIGTAMACTRDLAVGDATLNVSAHHAGLNVNLGTGLARDFLAAAPHAAPLRTVTSLTTDTFVDGEGDRSRELAARLGVDIIEMEDLHLALLAGESGFALTSLRVITDHGDAAAHAANLRSAADRAVWLLRRALRHARMKRLLTDVDNPPTADLPYRAVMRHEGRALSIPDGVRLARWAAARFGLKGLLPAGGRLDVVVTGGDAVEAALASPAGVARVITCPGVYAFAFDEPCAYARIAIADGLEAGAGAEAALPPAAELRAAVKAAPVVPVDTLPAPDRRHTLPPVRRLHVQGLNSISAEPEEGLLAATTIEELRASGHVIGRSDECPVWIYRSAHAAETSYFEPEYEVPMRAPGAPLTGTYLIATGLGPAIDPTAAGGECADTLMLGDEQCGRLVQYLDDLARGPFAAEDVFRYEGVAQRVGGAVVLSRIDRRRLLTTEGLNSLSYEPETLRMVYSEEYDRFLAGYFSVQRRERPAAASHLLLSSRGCGYNCSFCCSGGLQPFSALAPEVFVDLLRRVKKRHHLAPGEHLDVFILDSYFNRDPGRIIKIADLLEKTGLRASFEFYVRHNGLQAFLKRRADGKSGPVVNAALIEAYRRLGIDEVVMGVDAYTERSIRMLKTNVVQLVRQGDEARPLYSFADIRAVLEAIEAAGLRSRGFLLVYNPFVSDADRIETFYNLATLALTVPGFAIDADSSVRVNELKPFPGAPMTRAAQQVPGLIQGDRFDYRTPLGRLEDLMDLQMFSGRRTDPRDMQRFVLALEAARRRLLTHMLDHLDRGASEDAVLPALAELARHEEHLRPLIPIPPATAEDEEIIARLAAHAAAVHGREVRADAGPEALFYQALAQA